MFVVQKAVYMILSEDETDIKISNEPIQPKEGYLTWKCWKDVVTGDTLDTCIHAQEGFSFWETRIIEVVG